MLSSGTIPLTDSERAALDELLPTLSGPVSFTRRDPGESGPLLVQAGDLVYEVGD